MCGFVGIIGKERVSPDELIRARDAIAHRGPDDTGEYVSHDGRVGLGFCRLVIIDLTPAGHQPMQNEDGSIWIVFNGEIYNFVELRKELEGLGHQFRSESDTETIVHGYEEWAAGVVAHLRGMFAFAVWDSRRKRIFMARDRLGIKPLFYYSDRKQLIFASEIKAILRMPGIDRGFCFRGLYDYLTYNYVPEPYTAYEKIRKLPAGHFLIADCESPGDAEAKEYWDLNPGAESAGLSEDETISLVRESIADAVRSHMVADVPIGLFLSGGMDSSTIAVYMASLQHNPIQTFSIGFDVSMYNELPYAQLVADSIGALHHERIVGLPAFQSQLEAVCRVYDEPYADFSSLPTLAVSRLARDYVKVVLSGEGGDEAFAGYSWYQYWLRLTRLAQVVPAWARAAGGKLSRHWPSWLKWQNRAYSLRLLSSGPLERYGGIMSWISLEEKRRLVPPERIRELNGYDDYWYLRRYWRSELDPVTRMQYLDVKTYLPNDLLVKVDRASMAVSLEARVPMLDHRLIETLFAVPVSVRFKNGQAKYLLRKAMEYDLPGRTLARRKMGFTPPMNHWVGLEDRKWLESQLRGGVAVREGLLRSDALENLSAFRWGVKVWILLVLEYWARQEFGGLRS